MFFLLRAAFWLCIVLVLLPSGGSQPQTAAPKFDPVDAVSAAAATVSDLSNFCDRQPDACVVGGQAATAIGQRAQAGAKFLYEHFHDRVNQPATGSVASRDKGQSAARALPSQHTLTPADLKPAWRGPLPPRDPRRPA
jgi:hypothetical protein